MNLLLPYLLLVTFYTPTLANFNNDMRAALSASPYQGVAVQLMTAYDTGNYNYMDYLKIIVNMKQKRQHIWPWVFFNRFVGIGDPTNTWFQRQNKPVPAYFSNIKGMDIYNETGALNDFYNIWTNALKVAKASGSPGIVVDTEPYNNASMSPRVSDLAALYGKTRDEICAQLMTIGRNLADITIQEYPYAKLWFLDARVFDPAYLNTHAWLKEDSLIYINIGMLEELAQKKSHVELISGGEDAGYCYVDENDCLQKINSREQLYLVPTHMFPNLTLGATLAPWANPTKKEGWFNRPNTPCGNSLLKTMDDFKPIIGDLLMNFKYVWIYAAGGCGYNPYDAKVAQIYNQTISAALTQAKQSSYAKLTSSAQ
jgi:hypothetical protein